SQMCGIAGIVGSEPRERIGAMLQSIEHRGRDDEGAWTSGPIDVISHTARPGHRRLSIIDTTSSGHQPMFSADGRYVITLNGEIYNYRELREQLKANNHGFRTQ